MIAAKRVDDVDRLGEPGSFEYFADAARIHAGMVYVCPCGCGRKGALEFRPTAGAGASWQWDGDVEKPTLAPSIHHLIGDATHWHGWLRAGFWESC